jgi:hypothetical protein
VVTLATRGERDAEGDDPFDEDDDEDESGDILTAMNRAARAPRCRSGESPGDQLSCAVLYAVSCSSAAGTESSCQGNTTTDR